MVNLRFPAVPGLVQITNCKKIDWLAWRRSQIHLLRMDGGLSYMHCGTSFLRVQDYVEGPWGAGNTCSRRIKGDRKQLWIIQSRSCIRCRFSFYLSVSERAKTWGLTMRELAWLKSKKKASIQDSDSEIVKAHKTLPVACLFRLFYKIPLTVNNASL